MTNSSQLPLHARLQAQQMTPLSHTSANLAGTLSSLLLFRSVIHKNFNDKLKDLNILNSFLKAFMGKSPSRN